VTTLAEDLATLAGVVHAMPAGCRDPECAQCLEAKNRKRSASEALARVHDLAVAAAAQVEAGRAGAS
jgi:hypothetical protein